MYRWKIGIVFASLVIAFTALAYALSQRWLYSIQDVVSSAPKNSFTAFEKLVQLQTLAMHDAARQIASSELVAYLRTLEDFRGEFIALEKEIYRRYPSSVEPDIEEKMRHYRSEYVMNNSSFVKRFASILSTRVGAVMGDAAFEPQGRAAFLRDKVLLVEDCASVAVNNCFHKFTFRPLQSVLRRLQPTFSSPYSPDVVIVSDQRGVGWAKSDDPLWSDKSGFVEAYPVILRARTSGVVDDIIQLGDDGSYYFVTAMPMVDGGEYLGAILIGVMIDDSLLKEAAKVIGHEIAFALDDKILHSTNRDEMFQSFVSDILAYLPIDDRSQRVELRDGTGYAGVAFYFARHARYDEPYGLRTLPPAIDRLRVVLATHVTRFSMVVSALNWVTIGLGLALGCAGGILLWLLIRTYRKPFEIIDQGIHEIIDGNLDYQFHFGFQQDLPDNMAQSLNLMISVLSGRPVGRADADGAKQWAQSVLVEEKLPRPSLGNMVGTGGELQGRAVPPLPPTQRSADQLNKERAAQYYRRLYADYLAAQAKTGAGKVQIPYSAFLEQVVGHENALKRRLGARRIRFNVLIRDGNATLVPVLID
ncbi:MAG: hypothetical protein HUU55_13760 [Myxococcales bacterium]|nr:hypothetical protein [Myxococcales bacterium]